MRTKCNQLIKKECVVYAQEGINSRNFNKKFVNNHEKEYEKQIINAESYN